MWLLAGVALLGGLVGAAGVLSFRLSEREQRRGPRTERTGIEDDAVSVLSVLPQSVVVLEPDDDVLRASASAYGFGLVRNDTLAHPEVREMVAGLRRDGVIR